MRDDYKIQGPTVKFDIEIEKSVEEKISKMVAYSKLSRSEIANTALKMFISRHSDFLPPRDEERQVKT